MKKLVAVFLVLVVVAVGAAVAGILLARGDRPLAGPTVLVWRMDRTVLEQAPTSGFPFAASITLDSMAELYPALRAARDDRAVKGLAVYIEDADFGLAKAQEFRRQLAALRRAGKFVECYLETAGEGSNGTLAYYLATACEKIHLAPAGDLNLLGLYADSLFLRGTFEKLKIDPAFVHVGRYKSAVEAYTRAAHSPAAEEAMNAVLDSFYRQLVAGIAEARRLPPEEVRRLVDGAPYDAPEAVRRKLVDGLAYPDQFRDRLERRAGGEPRLVRLQDYRTGRNPFAADTIAIVFALGTIVRGQGGLEPWTQEVFLGSESLGEILSDLAEDDGVDAVVLRVDSPGGSALASDLILRQVELLAREKPVVVSMSDVAASGGYYIAAKAHKIVAEPATLTGSIGVFGGKFVTRRFQEEHLGVTHDTLKRGANADIYTSLAPFSAAQEARVEGLMRRVYATFVGHVARGRKLTPREVDTVAQGRVWTGEEARRLRLVDELGGFDRALELARAAADIEPDAAVRLAIYPEPPSLLDLLFDEQEEPLLPSSLAQLLRALGRPATGALELPRELARLVRPF
ncbi:MAG TPA: signal peptide peptidase SppA [Thermoanaerobaculia bacterium]|nr:signal peptide peptidase SppA [Thermoanaerobaculia bacterium]